MAFERGGYADKLGNRYEGRWVVRQLLALLNERLTQVTIEAVGDDETGVDLWVDRLDGTRQAQQCKARNSSKEGWSIADLHGRGILRFWRNQLDRSDCHEAALVSAVPATVLGDICESARHSSGDTEQFHRDQIEALGENRRKAFDQFCKYLDIDPSDAPGRAIAYGYLRRIHVCLWADDQLTREELIGQASFLVDGEPELVIASLADLVLSHLRKAITAEDVRRDLRGLGLYPRQLVRDPCVGPAVEELRQQFDDSVAPHLVAGHLIEREETKTLLTALAEDGVVVLHGAAGSGKTGVLYELTRLLRVAGRPYLPIRLDRREIKKTARQFGLDLGLPESPAQCLAALTGATPGVLILDQLDALRWTSLHSGESLDVCKAVVREIRALRNMEKPVSVVLACRTFDLEHDPELRNWLKDSPTRKCRRLEVKGLSDEAVANVVSSLGCDLANMSPRQREILHSPQHLAMWAELARAGETTEFDNGVQLMRLFWDNRYRELTKAGVTADQADGVINALAEFMEQNGRLSAPQSLVTNHQQELHELMSHGILQATGSQLSFCHQSYLDFRVASRLLREIHCGLGTVRAWLGGRDRQSLFRREQLRQTLSLLFDEAPERFLINIRELLADAAVRFHLKHLVLELVGQIERPPDGLLAYLGELLAETYWREHVLEAVCAGHPAYVLWLARTGQLSRWLDSGEEQQMNYALWLIRSVADKATNEVLDVIEPLTERDDEWRRRVLSCLGWHAENEPDRAFELRLRLARVGIVSDLVSWEKVAAKQPARAIRLTEAVVAQMEPDDLRPLWMGGTSDRRQSRADRWTGKDEEAMFAAADQLPELVWDLLMPHVARLTPPRSPADRALVTWDEDDIATGPGYLSLFRGVLELVIRAGKMLAGRDAEALLTRVRPVKDHPSQTVQRVLAEVFASLPAAAADEGVRWLLADTSRLSLGSGRKEPEWMPAVRLVEALSPHCSEQLFRELEGRLVHYHDPYDRNYAEAALGDWKRGAWEAYWGKPQHFLVRALSPQRRGFVATGLVGVLHRKFTGLPELSFLRSGLGMGGCVGSPLPHKKLEAVSDKAWLGIISNREIPFRDNHRWKQRGEDGIAESAVLHFARDLAGIARRFPERFGQLGAKFPANVHAEYVAAILEGIAQAKPNSVPDAEKAAWRPAGFDTILKFLRHVRLDDDRGVADQFCWLLYYRFEEDWPDWAIETLCRYATTHSDPAPGQLNTWPSAKSRDVADATVHGITENVLNCVRGVAGLAIRALLDSHPDLLPRLAVTIERMVHDPHPVVRAAAVEASLAVLNIDKDRAIEWFCAACHSDLRIAATHNAVWFFNCGIESHQAKLAPIIVAMSASPRDDVAEEGAEEITARWLFNGMFGEELERCRKGSVPQRKGVAQVASHFFLDNKYPRKCQELLLPLCDDPEKEVRDATRTAVHDHRIFAIPNSTSFILGYTCSRAFEDDSSMLFWAMRDHAGSLVGLADILLNVCERFAGPLRDSTRDYSGRRARDAHELVPLLLRLYEQSQDQPDAALKRRCLDAWDLLFENRVGMTRELTQAISC